MVSRSKLSNRRCNGTNAAREVQALMEASRGPPIERQPVVKRSSYTEPATGRSHAVRQTLHHKLPGIWFEGTVDCFMESVEAAKHYPAMKSQWIEFLGERPNPATERVEVTEASPV